MRIRLGFPKDQEEPPVKIDLEVPRWLKDIVEVKLPFKLSFPKKEDDTDVEK